MAILVITGVSPPESATHSWSLGRILADHHTVRAFLYPLFAQQNSSWSARHTELTPRQQLDAVCSCIAYPGAVRLVVAECSVDYQGRLTAHLPRAPRLLMVKADGSVLIHSDGGSYKPLNWMAPPCTLVVVTSDDPERAADAEAEGWQEEWTVMHKKTGDFLRVQLHKILSDTSHDLGIDPGLIKDGVEAHLQALLSENITTLGAGWSLVRREYPTAIGPVDILARDPNGATVAIEIKRRGEIEGVEQLTRYVELLNRDPLLTPVRGVFAAQQIRPQAKTLAADRGFDCITLDYDELKGIDTSEGRLF